VTGDPILVLAWLALAHLAADFLVQTETVATEKFGHGRRAWQALATHVVGVAVCLAPVVLAFGGTGLAFLVLVSVAHGVIDRTKIVWTRRVEARALRRAHRDHETEPVDAASSLGAGWTPMPGVLFVLDQLAHAIVIGTAWAVLLANAPLAREFADVVGRTTNAWDPVLVHRVVLSGVVMADLLIVNIRAGLLFVATLVHPRGTAVGADAAAEDGRGADRAVPDRAVADRAVPDPAVPSPNATPAATAYTVRIGPLVVDAESKPAPAAPAAGTGVAHPHRPVAPPAQVGAAVGVLERLIVVALVLAGATAAIGFVIAAKTLARFKQLDDRDFAEYYLLGTLASVTVALVSGLVAAAALSGA
jgi:hypothetical protein